MSQHAAAPSTGFSAKTVVVIVAATVLLTGASVWFVSSYLFPRAFRPVELSTREAQVLDDKLERVGVVVDRGSRQALQEPLQPEAYRESETSREIAFTERELNALLRRNTNLAERLAIDLTDNLASAKLLLPMDPDFPFVGGKTLRIDAGLELMFEEARPVVILRGVSVMGVPVPNAWLGNLKNVDLVREFGGERGFWSAFAAGVELIHVSDGELKVKLRE